MRKGLLRPKVDGIPFENLAKPSLSREGASRKGPCERNPARRHRVWPFLPIMQSPEDAGSQIQASIWRGSETRTLRTCGFFKQIKGNPLCEAPETPPRAASDCIIGKNGHPNDQSAQKWPPAKCERPECEPRLPCRPRFLRLQQVQDPESTDGAARTKSLALVHDIAVGDGVDNSGIGNLSGVDLEQVVLKHD